MSNQENPSADIAYVSPYDRETLEQDERILVLTPWTVQNICYEVLKNYMQDNPPQKEGYAFSQKYDTDNIKTGISLDIAYHYNDAVIQKRPGIFVARGEVSFAYPTMNQMIGINVRESEKEKFSLLQMPLIVTVVATNVGFAEQLAEYVFKIFVRLQEVIRNDFKIRQFKVQSLGQPALYLESKDHFKIDIVIAAAFDMGTIVKRDDLKLKTLSYTVFTSCSEQPLTHQ